MEYLGADRRPGPTELAHSGLTRPRFSWPPFVVRSAIPLAATTLLLGLWELGVRLEVVDALHFPAPSTIARTTWRLTQEGVLTRHLAATASRVAWSVLIGGSAGLLLGVAMGRSARLRAAVDPFVAALHPVPKIAILPLIMVIFGIGDVSLVIVIATGAFFPMLITTMTGVAQINPIHDDVARLHRASTARVMFRVVLPASAPSVLAGLRLALNTALLITIAVEMVAARTGLGSMIWLGWTTLRTEEIYVALAMTILFGLAVNLVISAITYFALPWQRGGEA